MSPQTSRKFTFAAAVLMAGGVQAATIGTNDWTRVAPAGGAFSVSMPGVPEHKTSPLTSNGRTSTLHTYMVESGRFVYAVFYNDLPSAAVNLRETLDAMRDASARGGRLIEEKEFTFNGYPGRSLTVEKDGYSIYTRFFTLSGTGW